ALEDREVRAHRGDEARSADRADEGAFPRALHEAEDRGVDRDRGEREERESEGARARQDDERERQDPERNERWAPEGGHHEREKKEQCPPSHRAVHAAASIRTTRSANAAMAGSCVAARMQAPPSTRDAIASTSARRPGASRWASGSSRRTISRSRPP